MNWYKSAVEQINDLFRDHDIYYKNAKFVPPNPMAAYTLLVWMKNHLPEDACNPSLTYHLLTGDVIADWYYYGVDLEVRVDEDLNIKYCVDHYDDDSDVCGDINYKQLDYTAALCIEELFSWMSKGERIQRKKLTQLFEL